jgi:predicted sugar kinase
MWKLSTGARLHCGLLETAPGEPLRFGGLGLMVEHPEVHAEIKVSSHSGIHAAGNVARERIEKQLVALEPKLSHDGRCGATIELTQLPPQHSGFGTGTQIACSVATLCRLWNSSQIEQERFITKGDLDFTDLKSLWPNSDDLFLWSGRGRRSSIGVYGFMLGGMIVDSGHEGDSQPGRVAHHHRFTIPLHVVIITPLAYSAITGKLEEHLIEQTTQQPNPVRDRMWKLISRAIVPAAQAEDWTLFGESLYEYGHLAGEQFAALQGGVYRDSLVAKIVRQLREAGLLGVCQSSWGPTVFGITPDAEQAQAIYQHMRFALMDKALVTLTKVLNDSAQLRWVPSES